MGSWLTSKFTQFQSATPGKQLSLVAIFTLILFLPFAVWLVLQPTRLFTRASLPVTPPVSSPGEPGGVASLAFSPSSASLAPGEETTLSLILDAGTAKVTAAEAVLRFNNDIIAVVETTPGSVLPVQLGDIKVDNTIGEVRFASGETPSGIKEGTQGILISLKIKAKEVIGSTEFTFQDGTVITAVGTDISVLGSATPGYVSVKEPEASKVNFKVKFQGISRSGPSQVINVTFVPVRSGTPNSSEAKKFPVWVTSDNSGVYSGQLFDYPPNVVTTQEIKELLPGTYRVFVKGPSHLQKYSGEHTIQQTGSYAIDISQTPLLAGDIRPAVLDDKISAVDYSLLVSHFGPRMPTEGTPADLDFDGDVDVFDYNFVVSNFGKTGEK